MMACNKDTLFVGDEFGRISAYNFNTKKIKTWKLDGSVNGIKLLGNYLVATSSSPTAHLLVHDIKGFMESAD